MLCRKALADPLWERAATVGATSAREQQLFAVAEDVSAAGLLVAYLAFAPLCEPGSIDFPTIQRWAFCPSIPHTT